MVTGNKKSIIVENRGPTQVLAFTGACDPMEVTVLSLNPVRGWRRYREGAVLEMVKEQSESRSRFHVEILGL